MGELNRHLLAPARLKLTTMLTAVSEVEFAVLRDGLGVSDSVLSKHVATLADAGYVRSRKGTHEGRRTTWVSLSPTGRRCSATTSQCCARSSTASTDPHCPKGSGERVPSVIDAAVPEEGVIMWHATAQGPAALVGSSCDRLG